MTNVQRLSRRALLSGAAVAVAGLASRQTRTFAATSSQEERVRERAQQAQATIDDVWADRAVYVPGEGATIHVVLRSAFDMRCQIRLTVRYLDQEITGQLSQVSLAEGESSLALDIPLPEQTFRGYGVDVELLDGGGSILARAGTALDVLESWAQAPRYGFLSDFGPGDPFAATTVRALARYHVNVVQFYDWMWRHYELMPPADDFTDALGRSLSLETVRQKARACNAHGMAAMGYAAVYGAEPEYALEHPGEMLYDASGTPYSIEKLFYVMNIHEGIPWRPHILQQMARSVREVPFDGLHLDQYGFPKDNAFGPGKNPKRYDLAEDFPPFIDDARAAVRRERPGTRVIFNAVENWPIQTVAPTTQDATYIEVWPPYVSYGDLQALILGARALAPEKQVILAAYMAPLLGALGDAVPPAERATRLASAAIWANGGFHLLVGENNGALCDAYYPKYATLMPDFAQVMRRYYDFVVRYENVLCDTGLVTATGDAALSAAEIRGHDHGPAPEPGKVWTICRSMPGVRTLSLINLTGAADVLWNSPKPPVHPVQNLTVTLNTGATVTGVFAADPDEPDLRPRRLPFGTGGKGVSTSVELVVPKLDYWTLVVVRTDES